MAIPNTTSSDPGSCVWPAHNLSKKGILDNKGYSIGNTHGARHTISHRVFKRKNNSEGDPAFGREIHQRGFLQVWPHQGSNSKMLQFTLDYELEYFRILGNILTNGGLMVMNPMGFPIRKKSPTKQVQADVFSRISLSEKKFPSPKR